MAWSHTHAMIKVFDLSSFHQFMGKPLTLRYAALCLHLTGVWPILNAAVNCLSEGYSYTCELIWWSCFVRNKPLIDLHWRLHTPTHTHTLTCLWLQSGTLLFYTCLHTMQMGTSGWPVMTSVDPSWHVNYQRVQTFYRATGDITIAKWGALTHPIAPVILYTALTRK